MSGFEPHWEDPPEDAGRRRGYTTNRFVEHLKTHPGKWALYVTDPGKDFVSSATVRRLEQLGAETRSTTLDRDGTPMPSGRLRVWARWPEVKP